MGFDRSHAVLIGIFSGLVFTFGIGMGIQLYNATSEASFERDKIENLLPKKADNFSSYCLSLRRS